MQEKPGCGIAVALIFYKIMVKKIEIQIDTALHGRKIRYILRNHMGFSAALVRRLKAAPDGILLNGQTAKQDTEVQAGDTLVLTICDKPSENIVPREIPLDILYEDEDVIAVNKPRSMPTHPSQNHHTDTLANAISYYFRGQDFTFRVITRLDRDTSGVVLIAKNPLAAQILSCDMQNGEIRKEYAAAVCGEPKPRAGTVSAPIKRQADSVILRGVSADGKAAVTDYAVEKIENGISFVRIWPKTGRTHQIRVHMQYLGTPIYGDDLHGAPQTGERTRLHCCTIRFRQPMTREEITAVAPVPEDIRQLFFAEDI